MKQPIQISPPAFPIDALPQNFRQIVAAMHELTHASIPTIASSVLTALAMAAQRSYRLQYLDSRITRPSLFMVSIDGTSAVKNEVVRRAFAGIQMAETRINANFKENYHTALKLWQRQNTTSSTQPHAGATTQGSEQGLRNQTADQPVRISHNSKPVEPSRYDLIYASALGNELSQAIERGQANAAVIETDANHIFSSNGLPGLDRLCSGWDNRDLMDTSELTNSRFLFASANREKSTLPPSNPYESAVHWNNTAISVYLCVRSSTLQSHLTTHPNSAYGFLERSLYTTDTATADIPKLTRGPKEEEWAPSIKALDVLNIFTTKTSAMVTRSSKLIIKMMEETNPALEKIAQLGQEIKDSGTAFEGLDAYLSQQRENAWRIALLLHCTEHMYIPEGHREPDPFLSEESLLSAHALVSWHLEVYLELFAPEFQRPSVVRANANKLEKWLIERCLENSTTDVTNGLRYVERKRNLILSSGPFRNDGAADRFRFALGHLRRQGKLNITFKPNPKGNGKDIEMVQACVDGQGVLQRLWPHNAAAQQPQISPTP